MVTMTTTTKPPRTRSKHVLDWRIDGQRALPSFASDGGGFKTSETAHFSDPTMRPFHSRKHFAPYYTAYINNYKFKAKCSIPLEFRNFYLALQLRAIVLKIPRSELQIDMSFIKFLITVCKMSWIACK